MKLGVIIPAYNREATIGPAVRSVLRQADAAALDVVVVDDGSTDATADVVMAMEAPAVRLVRQANQGVTRARNTGLASLLPDTDLVTFLDSDDISPEGRFAAEVGRFREIRDLEVTYGLMMLVEAIDDDVLAPVPGCRSVTVRGVSVCAGVFRRDVLDRLGGFDERFERAEDADLLFRLFEQSPKAFLSDVVAVYYRRHTGNMTNDRDKLKRGMMQAIMRSVQRRRANPQLASLDGIFDLNALRGLDWL